MKTTVGGNATAGGERPRFLLATSSRGLRVFALPDAAEVLLGRDAECAVVLDHDKVSRRHVRLRLGAACTIVDLGSRNGTRLGGAALLPNQERALAPGESFTVGPFSLMLLPHDAAPPLLGAEGAALRVEDPAAGGASPLLATVARAGVSVVLRGETGVGKEVLAQTLHLLSGRTGPLVAVNCAALAETLLESELFGHERGAFTGAAQPKAGLLETAAGGTVLLDEIGDMPLALQAKLLRAIEAREVYRVGGVKPIAIDARFLAATHRDLMAEAERGRFRTDLFYRLAGVTLEIPPLRERRAQIPVIAAELVAQAARRAGLPTPALAAAATRALVAHDWPGNVRELRNVLERAILLAGGGELRAEHVRFDAVAPAQPRPAPQTASAPSASDERDRIIAALDACAGNQTRAAKQLGISRATLSTRLALHDIPRPRKR